MEEFYELVHSAVQQRRCCERCGDRIWFIYADGHVWDECGSCEKNHFDLQLAGYVSTHEEPTGPPLSEWETRCFKGKNAQFYKSHEMVGFRLRDDAK